MSDPVPDPEILEARHEFYRTTKRALQAWAEDVGGTHGYETYIPLGPDLLRLLENLALEPAVSTECKAEIAVATAYFVAPMDIVPEEIVGPSGYVDDLALAALVIQHVQESAGEAIVQQQWHREEDVTEVVEGVLEFARYSMGPETWEEVQEYFDRRV